MPERTPPKLVEPLLAPAVRVRAFSATLPPVVPPPASEPMARSASRFRLAPLALARVTAELLPSAAAWLVFTVPAFSVVVLV